MRTWWFLPVMCLGMTACKTEHTIKIEPIEVKPMTLDINIRVQRELDSFFDFEKQAAPAAAPAPASTAPQGGTTTQGGQS